jgi:hypothetical protein
VTEERLDRLREAIDDAVDDLNRAWTETRDPWGGTNETLEKAIRRLQHARTADDIANGRDWQRPEHVLT